MLQLVWKSFFKLPKVMTYLKLLSYDAKPQEHAISIFNNNSIDKIRNVLFNTLIVSHHFLSGTIFPVSFELSKYIWVKVFKNGQSENCGRQPLKNFKGYDPLRQTIIIQIFKGCLPQILLGPFLNTLTYLMLISHITWVAFLKPLAPIILIYDQGMLNTAAEPYGAALMTPNEFSWSVPSGGTTGCVGKNGSRCFFLERNLILIHSFPMQPFSSPWKYQSEKP